MSHSIVKGILIVKHGQDLYLATKASDNNVTPRTYDVSFYSYAFESEAAVKAKLFAMRMSGSAVFDSTLARIRKVDSAELQGEAASAFERMKPRLESGKAIPYGVEDGIHELTRMCTNDYYSVEDLALVERAVVALRSGQPIPNPNEVTRGAAERYPLLRARSIGQSGLTPMGRDLLAESPELAKAAGPFGVTPLHRLAGQYTWGDSMKRVLDSARLLLDHGADPNAKNALDMVPLHVVAMDSTDRIELARLLLDRGAHVDARDHNAQTPLHYAVTAYRATEMCEALIAKGADIDAVDNLGRTPLMIAARSNDRHVAMLIDAGADLDKVDAQGRTAEGHALTQEHSSIGSLAIIQRALHARDERAALASITAGKAPALRTPARSL